MTGQYSIRNGLSLVGIPGGPNTLSAKAYTMGQLFKEAGYATAVYGKWHLGSDVHSLPGAHGFDDFYGIPPDTSWDSAADIPQIMQTHSAGNIPEKDLIERGGWINQQKANGPLERVKPFTLAVRAEIDNELTDRSVAFMKQRVAAGKPFFVYLPFSMGHAPNLPSRQFAGKSRVGQYGDKMMEGDYHVGQVMDALKERRQQVQRQHRSRRHDGGTRVCRFATQPRRSAPNDRRKRGWTAPAQVRCAEPVRRIVRRVLHSNRRGRVRRPGAVGEGWGSRQ